MPKKDPAFLFYPNDYIGGTMGMSFEEKGAYMELLMMQFNRGHMSAHMITQVVGEIWENIKHKFIQDENGLWYNERLEVEKENRKRFTESRRKNLKGNNSHMEKHKDSHMGNHKASHMENENENENISFNRGIVKGESSNLKEVEEEDRYDYFRAYWNINCGLAEGKLWETWKDWIEHKANRGEALTRKEALIQIKFLAKARDGSELIQKAIGNGWKGFIHENKNGITEQKGILKHENQEFDVIRG